MAHKASFISQAGTEEDGMRLARSDEGEFLSGDGIRDMGWASRSATTAHYKNPDPLVGRWIKK
jgi:hypothetical protein